MNFFQGIQHILTGIDQQRLRQLLLYGSPYYMNVFNINVIVREAVHYFINKTLHLNINEKDK